MNTIKPYLNEYIELLKTSELDKLCEIVNVLKMARSKKKNIFICGNGGSAATALHMSTDFLKTIDSTSIPIKVICLNANISIYSAIANDYGHEYVFSYQLSSLIQKEDVLIVISASGNSPNCCEAIKTAKKFNGIIISFTGFNGGIVKDESHYSFHIPNNDYFLIESVHLFASHVLTKELRREIACME